MERFYLKIRRFILIENNQSILEYKSLGIIQGPNKVKRRKLDCGNKLQVKRL